MSGLTYDPLGRSVVSRRSPRPTTTPTAGDAVTEGPIKFSAGNHQYWMDKKRVKGVTTLIKQGLPAPQLMYWSARTVAEWVADHPGLTDQIALMGGRAPLVSFLKEIPWQKRDEAAARGTEVHRLGEQLVHGQEIEAAEHVFDMAQGYARWLDEWQPKPILVERMVGNREHWYCGTFDLVAEINGTVWMLDLKTASGVYGENALQTDAYRRAEFWQGDDGSENPMPACERLGVLHIRADGTDLIPLESDGSAFDDFLAVAAVAKRAKRIKEDYVGAALVRDFESAA